ncbi:TonB-dependent receptor [Pontibacter sp. HJ8]
MKKVIYLLTMFIITSLSSSSFAQSEGMLQGTILDEKNQGLGFVNVAVLDASTAAVVTGAIADLDGSFRIKTPAKGRYQVKVSGLGYLPLQSEVFEVAGPGFSKDFGKLQLKPDVKTLKEVTVQTMRPTIRTEADKMVVSVEGTAMASGSTAYEVLEKSPGVWVDQDGNIRLNGKAGVMVMLNGRQSYLSGKELQNLLQSMSAENIKNLEIITNPSSKYDAEGTSGIININLKKNPDFGMSGSVYAGYQYNNLHTYTTGGDVSYKKGKWSTTASLDLPRRMRYRDMDMKRVFNKEGEISTFDQEGYEETERLAPALRLGTDYEINDKHSIGGLANLYYNDNRNLFRTDSWLRDGNSANDVFINSINKINSDYRNGTFNVHYTGKLDTVGTTLSADLDYVKISSRNDSEFFNTYDSVNTGNPARLDLLSSNNPTSYDIYSAKTDFAKKIGQNGKLELGAKASHVVSDNELLFYQNVDGRDILDVNRTSHFIYKEDIFAAYTNYSTSFGKKWKLQAGLRAEQTFSEGNSLTRDEKTKRDYLDLFPSVFVQQKVSDNYQVSYKYSRRINRPFYENLNPFIFYLDPYTWAQGNPYLRPQYTNSFELTQTLKDSYNLTLGYAVTKDFMGEVPDQNPENNTTVFQQRNMAEYKNLNATLVAPVRISGKWEINNNATVSYSSFTTNADNEDLLRDQLSFTAQSNQNIQLPHGIKLELTGAYQGPGVYGLYEFKSLWWVDAGLKRSFLDDKLTLTLNATDIFRSRQMYINTSLNGNTNAIEQYHGSQSIRLNLRYRFNKGKEFEAKKRNVNLDELNRTGN